jgi:Regulator of chromosome condensation (RCC1) repeat
MFMQEKSCLKIQPVFRGFRVRLWLKRQNYYAEKIQGYWRMTKIYTLIQEMRNHAILLQRNVRVFLGRKRAIDTRFKEFINDESPIFEKELLSVQHSLFPNADNNKTNDKKTNNNYLSSDDVVHTKSSIGFFTMDPLETNHHKKKYLGLLPEPSGLSEPKIVLFAKILDVNFIVDSGEVYNKYWSIEYEKIYNLNMRNGTPIQSISIGGCHTIALNNKGKAFSWGWNNYGQCGFSSKSKNIN